MAIFKFSDRESLVGTVRDVDTRKVSIHVKSDEDLRKAKVGQLICLEVFSGVETWLVAIVEKVTKSISVVSTENDDSDDLELEGVLEEVVNTVKVSLVGSVKWNGLIQGPEFTRSLMQVPDIDAKAYVLAGEALEGFMNILVAASDTDHSLDIGSYVIDERAKAYLDGNKFFQRHAALLGSTGSGKSWTVASILERAAKLPSSNLIVFDLHGEYRSLSYAKQLRIPGPEELGSENDDLLYLPYWLLNSEEMQSLFIDSSSYNAQNQVSKFQELVITEKTTTLKKIDKHDVLAAFTLDSPIPYQISEVVNGLRYLNEEMVPGSRSDKKGPFNGSFDRLLARIESKLGDRRYGFLFQGPESANDYGYLGKLTSSLMNFSQANEQVKVIDFSEVPSDILPVIVGLVGRLVYQVQFWTPPELRHPIALVCDEAHLYLPKKDGRNPVEKRAIESFERIAKEGRKYGVALFIVSQRPSDVSTTILSQCNNVISLRLTNAEDQSTVKKLLPDSLDSLLDILPIMDVGEALVVGDAVLLPSRIKINKPSEKPLSETVKFWERWMEKKSDLDYHIIVENLRKQSRSCS